MRTAPPSGFTLTRFGLWRCGVAVLCVAAAAALAGWVWPMRHDAALLAAAGLGLAACVAALAAVLRGPPAFRLRWVAPDWYVEAGRAAAAGPYRLDVPVDLGVWMLLRLRAEGRPSVWIPVQRRGHETQWHGLRRAVYFPRPTDGGPPAAESHLPE